MQTLSLRPGWLTHRTLKLLRQQVRQQVKLLGVPPRRLKRYLGDVLQADAARPSYPMLETFRVPGAHAYFGYFDVTPFSSDGRRLLAGVAKVPNRARQPGQRLQVGYFERGKGYSFVALDETTAWSWQLGCRMQWLPEAEDTFLFNKVVDGRYVAVIRRLGVTQPLKVVPHPVYAMNPAGTNALSVNFSRLGSLRPGYGCLEVPDETSGQPCPAEEGVWNVDLSTGRSDLLLSLTDLAALAPHESMQGATHYVNHPCYNPSGSRFLVLHLWIKNGNRYCRLVTADADGGRAYALINEGKVSHFAWLSDDTLLAYGRHAASGHHYHLYKDRTAEREVFAPKLLTTDGHPSYSPDRRWLLTDTYPDAFGEKRLLLLPRDDETNLIELGRFYTPASYHGDVRCDLHPRWSPLGDAICFDSCHEGTRAMYVLNMSTVHSSMVERGH